MSGIHFQVPEQQFPQEAKDAIVHQNPASAQQGEDASMNSLPFEKEKQGTSPRQKARLNNLKLHPKSEQGRGIRRNPCTQRVNIHKQELFRHQVPEASTSTVPRPNPYLSQEGQPRAVNPRIGDWHPMEYMILRGSNRRFLAPRRTTAPPRRSTANHGASTATMRGYFELDLVARHRLVSTRASETLNRLRC